MSRRFLISIGINDYSDKPLSFSVKDVDAISKCFKGFCNIDPKDIREISSEKIRPNGDIWETFVLTVKELQTVFVAKENDLFFYFSGHGIKATQTTLAFKKQNILLSKIIEKLNELNPKTLVLIIDSCYSGIGIEAEEKSIQFFSQNAKESYGTFMLASCSKDQTSKASAKFDNSWFTRFLINNISDLKNYNEHDYLDINTLYSKVDLFFRENPDFKQNPYQQIKSVGGYPLAYVLNEKLFFARYDIENPYDYNWSLIIESLNLYLDTKKEIIGEFSRLIREHCFNTKSKEKGKATIQSIQIEKNKVLLIDNGEFFDLFEPCPTIKAGGGIKTAKGFQDLFSTYYSLSTKEGQVFNTYSFNFKALSIGGQCKTNMNWDQVNKLNTHIINIDQNCEEYTIHFENYLLTRSMIYFSIKHLFEEAKRNRVVLQM